MKKLMVLAAILALAIAAAVPAVAQVGQEVGQETESGGLGASFGVANEGDYAHQCTPAMQFGNTGNLQNANAFLQYAGVADDFTGGGIAFGFEPELETACERTVQQSAAASSDP